MSRRLLPLLLLAGAAPGCLTGRAAIGPSFTPAGPGLDAAVTIGAGGGAGEQRAWYVVEEIGFVISPVDREPGLLVRAGVDYLSEDDDGIPWRIGARVGGRPVVGSGQSYAAFGVTAALFPISRAGPAHDDSQEDKFGDFFGHQRGYRNVGLEVGVERLVSGDVPDEWLFTLRLVGELNTLPD